MGFYVGFTKHLKLRFEQHRQGLVEATKKFSKINLLRILPQSKRY